jgi:hypothetical protein
MFETFSSGQQRDTQTLASVFHCQDAMNAGAAELVEAG